MSELIKSTNNVVKEFKRYMKLKTIENLLKNDPVQTRLPYLITLE